MPNKVSKKFAAAFGADTHADGTEQRQGRARERASGTCLRIDLDRQCLELCVRGNVQKTYPVSTAANGAGEQEGSECTPRGKHTIRAKMGAGADPGAVFVARRLTGERYTPSLRAAYPDRDWILTRILWLSGLEPGRNRLGRVDTMRRYIYIHGCPDDVDITLPGSRGCVRMRNDDIIDLFERVAVGAEVVIETARIERRADARGGDDRD